MPTRHSDRVPRFPGGKLFALTFIDDTDVATVANVAPVYELLHKLGMKATKTVWPLGCPEGSADYSESQTLDDTDYKEFVLQLHRLGFEITWHNATMESSTRERTIAGLKTFYSIFGFYPRIHPNHALNKENIYWGAERIDVDLLRIIFARLGTLPKSFGHVEASKYWWGDLCAQHIDYARNLTFDQLNIAKLNPSMPYRDESRPLARWWFSAADANDAEDVARLLRSSEQEKLQSEMGFCVIATHFGKNFLVNGRVHPAVQARLEELSRRPGWFPTVGELLDWLRVHEGKGSPIPAAEWRSMQWRWAKDLFVQKLRKNLIKRAF